MRGRQRKSERQENGRKRGKGRDSLLDKEKRQPCAYALRISEVSSMGRLPIRIRCRGRALSLSGSVASAFRSCVTLSLPLPLSLSLSLSRFLSLSLFLSLSFPIPLLFLCSRRRSSLFVSRFNEEVGSSKKSNRDVRFRRRRRTCHVNFANLHATSVAC